MSQVLSFAWDVEWTSPTGCCQMCSDFPICNYSHHQRISAWHTNHSNQLSKCNLRDTAIFCLQNCEKKMYRNIKRPFLPCQSLRFQWVGDLDGTLKSFTSTTLWTVQPTNFKLGLLENLGEKTIKNLAALWRLLWREKGGILEAFWMFPQAARFDETHWLPSSWLNGEQCCWAGKNDMSWWQVVVSASNGGTRRFGLMEFGWIFWEKVTLNTYSKHRTKEHYFVVSYQRPENRAARLQR